MKRWMAQRPVAVQPASDNEQGGNIQMSGPDQRSSGRRGHLKQVGGVGMLLHHVEDFDITDEQVEKLSNFLTDFELEKVDLDAALHKAKIKLRVLMRDVDAREHDVLKAIDHVSEGEANLRKMRYRHLQQTRALLNDQQRNSLKTFHLKQSRAKAQGGRGGQ
ncbi:MAG: hypothetical protein WBV94_15405 [Blastocatellia bacterium]